MNQQQKNTDIDRRGFVKLSAISATLAFSATSNASDLRRVKVGQIGTKHAHAAGQMQTLRKLSDTFDVVGVVEPDNQRWDRVKNSPVYRDVPRLTEESLLETDGIEVIAVETEIRDLLPTAQRCIDAGLHVHIDKPAGESLIQLRKLQEAARQRSLAIQMGYMFRYNPGFAFLYQAVRVGLLGDIFEVHGVMSKTSSESARVEMAEYPGGAMFELGCHLIDPLIHILGPPTAVTPILRKTRSEQDLYDNTLAIFEYPSTTATIRSSLVEVNGSRRRQFVVCGTRGTIAIRPLESPKVALTLAKSNGGYRQGTSEIALPKSLGRYHGAWIALANTIRTRKPLFYTPEHDYAVQRAVLAASGVIPWE